MGLAAGKPVPAVFDYCDVCDVNIALERLVSQVVEKNKSLNLAETLSFTFIPPWFVFISFVDDVLKRVLGFQTSCGAIFAHLLLYNFTIDLVI